MSSRRNFLGLSLVSSGVTFVTTAFYRALGAALEAADWQIDVSVFASNCKSLTDLLLSKAATDGDFPSDAFYQLFPLNGLTADTRRRVSARGKIIFASNIVTNTGQTDVFSFVDANIGRVAIGVPPTIRATVDVAPDNSAIAFKFKDSLPKVSLYGVPQSLHMPIQYVVEVVVLTPGLISLNLRNAPTKKKLNLRLTYQQPTGMARQFGLGEQRVGIIKAMLMVADGSTFCCEGICTGSNGQISGGVGANDTYALGYYLKTPNGCATMEESKINDYNAQNPGNRFTVVHGGFGNLSDAQNYLRDTLKGKCP
jgi:hypothetical protein